MPTCQDVVTHALRLSGVVGIGDIPEAEEAEFAQNELQALIGGWFEQGMFGALADVTKTAAYTANEFERVNAAVGIVITLPLTITDDDSRAPYDLAGIVISSPQHLFALKLNAPSALPHNFLCAFYRAGHAGSAFGFPFPHDGIGSATFLLHEGKGVLPER